MGAEQERRLMAVNEELDALAERADDGDLDVDEQERLEELREERRGLEAELGEDVQGLRGYRGGPG